MITRMISMLMNGLSIFWHDRFFIPSLAVLSAAIVYQTGYTVEPDSNSYIAYSMYRTYGYPVILALFRLVFGENNYLYAVCFSQYFMWIYASKVLVERIKHALAVDNNLMYLGIIFPSLPLFFYNFPGIILTESYAFSCWLLFLANAISLWETRSRRYAIWCSVMLLFGMSLRPQLAFMAIVMFLIGTVSWAGLSRRISICVLGLTVCAVLASSLLDRSFRYIYHFHFGSAPYIGVQIMAAPLYLFDDEYALSVADPRMRNDLLWISNTLKSEGNHVSQAKENKFAPSRIQMYAKNYNTIIHDVVTKRLFNIRGVNNRVDQDAACLNLAKAAGSAIIRHKPLELIKLYAQNVIVLGFGSWDKAVLVLATLLISTSYLLKSWTVESFILSIGSAAYVINTLGVALLEPVISRYEIYTEPIFSLMLISNIFAFMLNRAKQKKSGAMPEN